MTALAVQTPSTHCILTHYLLRELSTHIKEETLVGVNRLSKCTICGYGSKTQGELETHIKLNHQEYES